MLLKNGKMTHIDDVTRQKRGMALLHGDLSTGDLGTKYVVLASYTPVYYMTRCSLYMRKHGVRRAYQNE